MKIFPEVKFDEESNGGGLRSLRCMVLGKTAKNQLQMSDTSPIASNPPIQPPPGQVRRLVRSEYFSDAHRAVVLGGFRPDLADFPSGGSREKRKKTGSKSVTRYRSEMEKSTVGAAPIVIKAPRAAGAAQEVFFTGKGWPFAQSQVPSQRPSDS